MKRKSNESNNKQTEKKNVCGNEKKGKMMIKTISRRGIRLFLTLYLSDRTLRWPARNWSMDRSNRSERSTSFGAMSFLLLVKSFSEFARVSRTHRALIWCSPHEYSRHFFRMVFSHWAQAAHVGSNVAFDIQLSSFDFNTQEWTFERSIVHGSTLFRMSVAFVCF